VKRAGQLGLYPGMERHEVEAWIESRCRPERRPGGYRLRWRERRSSHAVTLDVILDEQLDVPVVVLYASLFTSTGFDLASALRNNRFLSAGSIALDGDQLVLRHVLALEMLSIAELERSLQLLALEASTLREACIRRPLPQAVFTLFAHLTH
jgi:hypothetical protein